MPQESSAFQSEQTETKRPANSPSRRTFLQTGAAGAAVAAASAVHVSAQDAAKSKSANDTVTIGIIGTGGRGGGALNDTMSINDNIRLVATADLYPEKSKRLLKGMSKRHEGKVAVEDSKIYGGLDGYKRILEDPKIDLVLLTTSPGFRPYHIAEAVDAGKHVFAEKPSCVDPAGYRVCVNAHDAAERNKTSIVTGTQYRRQVNYVGAIEQMRKGAIGRIVNATTRYCSTGIWYRPRKSEMSDAEYQLNNWMHFIWLSGDQIAEQAVHNIDLMNWVMDGPPEQAYGSGGRFTRPEDSEMWDNISVDYDYADNKTVSFMCRQIPRTKGENGNVIYGTEGTCYIAAGSGGSRIVDLGGKETWAMKGSIGDAYKQEHKDLIESIRSGKPIVELKQTADSSLTAVMGRVAAYTGQRVTWDFLTKESKLDLFPKDLSMQSELPAPKHASPGTTKLI
jgi:predicted dehydrogenase